MSETSRRALLQALLTSGLFALLPRALAQGASSAPSKSSDLTQCFAFTFDSLAAHPGASGTIRPVLSGAVPTGEHIELHETTLLPGAMPHPPHQHRHEELMLIREGTLDFLYAGQSHTLTPGGVAYVASNELHGLKNIGATPAQYFVIAISREDA